MASSTALLSTGDGPQDAGEKIAPADMAADQTEKNNRAKKKKKKIRPRLKPISSNDDLEKSPLSSGDDLGFGNFLPASDPSSQPTSQSSRDMAKSDADFASSDTTGNLDDPNPPTPILTTPPKIKIKQRISMKIQPRSSPRPFPNDVPQSPDDDDYDGFGFGLVKSGPKGMMPNESAEAGFNTSVGNQGPKTSRLSLRRVLSSESYISDDSSSSESALYVEIKRDLMKEDELEHVFVKEMKDGSNRPHYAPRRIHSKTSSQATEQRPMSSVSFAASALEIGGTDATTESDAVHLMRPYQTDDSNDASFSSSDSSLAPSAGESSYFSADLPQSHHNHQPPPLSNPHSFPKYHQNPPSVPLASRPLTPPLLLRSYSAPQHAIELKLSLSEDDDVSSGRRLRDSLARSTDFEQAGDENERVKRRGSNLSKSISPTRHTATPFSQESNSSVDDQVIANELSDYSLSDKLRRDSIESLVLSGRHAPVGDSDTPTPVRSFYASPRIAMLAATAQSTAKPRAHHDSSFLTNLREGWMGGSIASASEQGSFGSPRGAFGEPEVEERSPPRDLSVKSSSTHTPHSNIQSLAYSDEEDNERTARRRSKSSCFGCRDADDEEAMATKNLPNDGTKFNVYSSRWIMLLYMSLLNLLSGWTCFSIAPISILTSKILDVDPESLVALFLAANVLANACEPAILGRLGLRRTVLLGALLLMMGNVVKSGGASEMDQLDGWRVYLGFFLTGLSQPLYQCTATYIVVSWFPEWERTFATGVALNSNRLGIGCAFVFGSLLVETSDDVLAYFHLLSVISTVLFVAVAMQFDDAPPTPPSETARVIRGTLERPILARVPYSDASRGTRSKSSDPSSGRIKSPKIRRKQRKFSQGSADIESSKIPFFPSPASFGSVETSQGPSSAFDRPKELVMEYIDTNDAMAEYDSLVQAPSPITPGPVARVSYGSTDISLLAGHSVNNPNVKLTPSDRNEDASPFPNLRGDFAPRGGMPGLEYYNFGQQFQPKDHLPPTEDDGAEPVITQTPRHLDIDIRGDQIWRSLRACFARKGFSHCVLAFATSGITINALLTFMDYLVTLDGSGQEYVGIVGGTFQLLIMIASIMCGRQTDKIRKYYIIIIALLALGALALALCDANLDSGQRLWANLMMVAVFLGPLQTLSTELGVEVVYPLSENTVLVNQQLFSNLLSAACIPMFKALRDISISVPLTYSFYLLLMIHVLSTIYFATFDVQYLCHEEEERKKKQREQTQTPEHEIGNVLYPKPHIRRDEPWGKKYPFLIPSSSAV